MVQAAVTGAMDFTRMDPRDRWWWRKLRWTLHAVNRRNLIEALETQHHHWITLFSNSSLTADSFSDTKGRAYDILNRILKARYPWAGDTVTVATNTQEGLVKQFRELYGYPGEERYETMLTNMMDAFKRLEEGRA